MSQPDIESMTHTERVELRDKLHALIYAHNVKHHPTEATALIDQDHSQCGNGARDE